MQKKTIAISLAAILASAAVGSVVYAQVVPHGPTRAEVQERAAFAFDRLDVNVDGQIDAADRTEAQAERLRVRFDAADSNSDGSLAFEEFSAQRDDMRGDMRSHFGGRPGRGEGRHGGEGFGHHGMRGGADLLGMAGAPADTNSDDAITQAEYNTAVLGHFDRADANDDGVMTREEVLALRQTIRSEAQARRAQAQPTAQGS